MKGGRRVYLRSLVCTVIVILVLLRSPVQARRRVRHHRSSNSDINALQSEFEQNSNLVHSARWKCNVPKQKLVYLSESTAPLPPDTPDTIWLVEATVLHRCEQAFGCCKLPKTCQPVITEQVTVTLKKRHLGPGGTETFYRLPFTNHTQCACRNP